MTSVTREMDDLRIALAEVDVLSLLTAEVYDREDWIRPDSVLVERVASLLGLISKSAGAAIAAYHRLHGAVADAAPVTTATERWDHERGTAPGEVEALSPEDAGVVRQLRERSPDGRFDGALDAELIQLFKRNKRVLARSEEDVIAAMTHLR